MPEKKKENRLMLINACVVIHSGCVFARRLSGNQNSQKEGAGIPYRVLSLRHFADNEILDAEDPENEEMFFESPFPTLAESSSKKCFLATPNDVIVRLNYPHGARLVGEKGKGLLVPSAFAIMRTNLDRLDPAFLAYYLNAPATLERKVFQKKSFGMLARPVTIEELKKLEVSDIPLVEQKKIAALWADVQKEQALLKRLADAKLKLAHLRIQERMEKGVRS